MLDCLIHCVTNHSLYSSIFVIWTVYLGCNAAVALNANTGRLEMLNIEYIMEYIRNQCASIVTYFLVVIYLNEMWCSTTLWLAWTQKASWAAEGPFFGKVGSTEVFSCPRVWCSSGGSSRWLAAPLRVPLLFLLSQWVAFLSFDEPPAEVDWDGEWHPTVSI